MNKDNLLTNAWVSILCSIFMGGVFALIFNSTRLSAFALGFAVTRELMNVLKTKLTQQADIKCRIDILKRFATEKLGQTRYLVQQKKVNSIVLSLATLEYIITEISKCCDMHNEKMKYKRVKGLVSDTKTTFDKSQYDNSIQKPYSDAITVISNIETYINDL